MDWLHKHFPILFSATAWGLILSFLFWLVAYLGWADQVLLERIALLVLELTGVNVVWKAAKKTKN